MAESDPIRVFARDGKWLIDYGSYAHGYHLTRSDAIETATRAARSERRELVLESGGLGEPTTRPWRNAIRWPFSSPRSSLERLAG